MAQRGQGKAGITRAIESLQATERALVAARTAICDASIALTQAATGGVQYAAYEAGRIDTLHEQIEQLRMNIRRARTHMQENRVVFTRNGTEAYEAQEVTA